MTQPELGTNPDIEYVVDKLTEKYGWAHPGNRWMVRQVVREVLEWSADLND